jgi:Sec-independent protein translocase protein TatA
MGFGVEMIFLLMLGFLVLGPKQLRALLGNVARVKAQVEEVTRGFKSQLASGVDPGRMEAETDVPHKLIAPTSNPHDSGSTNRIVESRYSHDFIN